MNEDIITVAEYPGGVIVTSVVRPTGPTGAEHVFVVRRAGRAVGEADTIKAAVNLALAASAAAAA